MNTWNPVSVVLPPEGTWVLALDEGYSFKADNLGAPDWDEVYFARFTNGQFVYGPEETPQRTKLWASAPTFFKHAVEIQKLNESLGFTNFPL